MSTLAAAVAQVVNYANVHRDMVERGIADPSPLGDSVESALAVGIQVALDDATSATDSTGRYQHDEVTAEQVSAARRTSEVAALVQDAAVDPDLGNLREVAIETLRAAAVDQPVTEADVTRAAKALRQG